MQSRELSLVVFAVLSLTVSPMLRANSLPAAPGLPGACSLLSAVEVGRLAGISVAGGATRIRTGGFSGCSYQGEYGRRVLILIRSIPAGDEWAAAQVARMSQGLYQPVAGIGKLSFHYAIGGGDVLCVFGASYYLQLSVLGGEGRSGALENLALTLLARLR